METDIQTRTQQHASDLNLDITDQRVRTKSAVPETTNRTGGKHPAVSPSHASDLDDVFEVSTCFTFYVFRKIALIVNLCCHPHQE